MTTQLDPETWLRVNTILSQCQRSGRDPGEELHRAGLLLTPAKERQLRIGGMEFLLREICSWRPAEFLRRRFSPNHPATPTDMYGCVVGFVEEHVAAAKKGGA